MSAASFTFNAFLLITLLASCVGLWVLWLFLPRLQNALRKPGRTWIAALIAALVVILAGLPVIVTSFRLASQRAGIIDRLANANLNQRDPATVELLEQGRVTVGDRSYVSMQLRSLGEQLFDRTSGRLVVADQIAELLMAPSMPAWAPPAIFNRTAVVGVVLAAAAIAAIAAGLGLAPMMLAVLLGAIGGGSIALLRGETGMLVAIVGMVVLIVGYGVLSRLVLRALSGAGSLSAVANIVVRESTRQWYTGAFILVLLVVLPLVPLAIDAGPLRYRIQAFLSWSLGVTFGLAGLLTLVLACATVALEIRDRQIWQTLTKPVDRMRYILGKWLGVVAVNAVLLLVSGVSILLFVEYMRTQPAQDFLDEMAVRDEVLAARVGVRPVYEPLSPDQVRTAVDDLIAADPSIRQDIDMGFRNEAEVRRALGDQIRRDALSAQRLVPAGESRTYRFPGMGAARAAQADVSLSFLFHIGASSPHEQHPVVFRFADGSWMDRIYVPAQRHTERVRWQNIGDDGTLVLEIMNIGFRDGEFFPGSGTLNWDANGIEVLYKAGSFEMNFVRAMVVEWVKLSFLAMLGICAATVLNFPVALLFSATVYLIGSLTPFLAVAIEEYWVDPNDFWLAKAFQHTVRGIAQAAYFALSGFGGTSGETLLVEGRLVPWSTVGRTIAVIGVLWTGVTACVGWIIFRRKELAIYSGQGG
ncbi:MAG: ABC transporter permease subunit [Phycisphaeraceae bacterium]|nr:ABC transporter permease subunit [Phycisphaeraceae bacterium]